jgi:hypothetical protein
MAGMKLQIIPVSISEAKVFVDKHHRHRVAPVGGKFAVGVADEDGIVHGVAMVGRPVSRGLDDSWTLEVQRLCTDGTKNACSMLYSACWRAARALGWRRLITYIIKGEKGVTLRAAGWKELGKVTARLWHCKSRPRVDLYPRQEKIRFGVGDFD